MNRRDTREFEILDCTIRDGGYLNNWDFDARMVKETYRSLSKTGVDFIEIGYRNKKEKDRGIWYSVTEEMIADLVKGVSGVSIALMLDLARADIAGIPRAEDSAVKLYRVACHKDNVIEGIDLCGKLKSLGYMTSIQLMGIVGYSEKELAGFIRPLSEGRIDYIYFADSYGSLFPEDIGRYIKILKETGKKTGFHPHNSLQMGFANTLEAVRNHIDIVDGTVYGMGRGSGNLPLEALIAYLEKTLDNKKYNSMPVMDLIDRYFAGIKASLGWGYSLPYMLSGILEVHPDYARELVELKEYNVEDMVKTLEIIKSLKPVGFKREMMDRVIASGFIGGAGSGEDEGHDAAELRDLAEKYAVGYKDRHMGRDFLILATGPSLKEYKKEINEFISKYKPVILGANYLGDLFVPDYHAFSNKKRFVNYVAQVAPSSALLLSSSFDGDFINEYTDRRYERIVHLNRASGAFDIKNDVITSNCRTVSILLIAVAIVMGAKRIFVAGMDGYKSKENFLSNNVHFYDESDEAENFRALIQKHNWNEALLNGIDRYLSGIGREGVHIITPTNHKSFYNSIYNWIK
ncbi:MAG: aldolase catalytic domain-containing protein [Candidatus Omnitrophota bacterium]